MAKFRKKPVEIIAHQLTNSNFIDLLDWANTIQPADKKILFAYENGEFTGLHIPTKEGVMLCAFGDYLIKEPFPTDDRMFYPCKADMFELTYEQVNE